jgi:hypothetical protein
MLNFYIVTDNLNMTIATGRATLAGQIEGDGPDERGYSGPPDWGLRVRLTISPRKKLIVTKPYNKPRNIMNTRRRQRTGETEQGIERLGGIL